MIHKLALFAKIWKNQWKPRELLRKEQDEKLRNLVKHAYETVPFYRSLFGKRKLLPKDIQGIKDLHKLPILTKKMVREAGMSLLSTNYERKDLLKEHTSGSTGKPLTIYRTRKSEALAVASKLRVYMANNYKLWQKTAKIELTPPKKKFFHKLGMHRLYDVPFTSSLPRQTSILKEVQAEVFQAIPSRLESLGDYVEEQKITFPKPKLIFSASETLSEQSRRQITKAFGVQPIDMYGSTENKEIAWECPAHEGLHISEDLLHVEVIPHKFFPKNKRCGRIVVTDFTNPAMPLLRYDTEDIGILRRKRCSCGRTFALLEKIIGRVNQFIILPSGKKLPGNIFVWSLMKNVKGVTHYKLVQKKDNSLILYLVKERGFQLSKKKIKALFEGKGAPLKKIILKKKRLQTRGMKSLAFTSEVNS